MMRMETNAVLRYFEPADEFVKVRVFTDREGQDLLRDARIAHKKAYVQLVVSACLISPPEGVLRLLREGTEAEREAVEATLYALCVDVNPSLDIRRVSLPVPGAEASPLHLLDAPASTSEPDLASLRDLEARLARRIIGQGEAVHSVARAVRKALAGMRDERRPIATFLFVGQTGVGKTELAKALTEALFHDSNRLVRIDGSEFALPHEYAKLIGAPPGYVGHDQGGYLTEALRQLGAAVVLFDEVEKTDEKVHNLLLQVSEEGQLTDAKGRRVDFHETVIVLTSNLGTGEIEGWRNRIGFDRRRDVTRDVIAQETLAAVKERFRPEFVNRLSEIVVFNAVGLPECEKIATLFLDDVRRHAERIPIEIEYAPAVPKILARMGYNPEFGAREIRRTVEREVESPLSDLLIDGKIRRGDRVRIRSRKDRIVFHRN